MTTYDKSVFSFIMKVANTWPRLARRRSPGPASRSRSCRAGGGWGRSGCRQRRRCHTSPAPGPASSEPAPATGAGTCRSRVAGGPTGGRSGGGRGLRGERDRLNRCSRDAWELSGVGHPQLGRHGDGWVLQSGGEGGGEWGGGKGRVGERGGHFSRMHQRGTTWGDM